MTSGWLFAIAMFFLDDTFWLSLMEHVARPFDNSFPWVYFYLHSFSTSILSVSPYSVFTPFFRLSFYIFAFLSAFEILGMRIF